MGSVHRVASVKSTWMHIITGLLIYFNTLEYKRGRKEKGQGKVFWDVREQESWSPQLRGRLLTDVDPGCVFFSWSVSSRSVLLLHQAESDSAFQHLHTEPGIDSGLMLTLERREKQLLPGQDHLVPSRLVRPLRYRGQGTGSDVTVWCDTSLFRKRV